MEESEPGSDIPLTSPEKEDKPKSWREKLSLRRFNTKNRNIVLISILAGILLIVGLWAFVFHKNNDKEVAQLETQEVVLTENALPIDASIVFTEGIVEYSEDGEWTKADVETKIVNGMGVRTTGAASRSVIGLEDGSEIRLDANTEIVIESLTETRVVVVQKTGYIYSRVVDSDQRDYIIQTENAQFKSQGTAFRTSSTGDEEAVEAFQNSVQETRANLKAEEGEKLIAKSEQNPDKDGTKEPLNIEALKEDEFIKWNRDRDLASDDFKNQLGYLSDFDSPEITDFSPKSGSEILVETGSSEGEVEISGKTEGGSTLTVQSKSKSGSKPVSVDVASDGSFKTPMLKAPVGNSVFEFVAKDRRGNTETVSISYVFKRESSVQTQGITLTLNQTATNLNFSWTLQGITTPDGVHLIFSDTENPTLSGTSTSDLIASGTTSKSYGIGDFGTGKTLYFRVCRFLASTSTCDNYSNQITAVIP